MKYADLEGLEKKDPFKKGIIGLLRPTAEKLLKSRIRILPESLGEPAALLDFLDDDFYLAFKTDGVGTKSLIADTMADQIRRGKIKSKIPITRLYSGLGIDLIASNVNDLICLGAEPFALSDEVAAGNYKRFLDKDFIEGLYQGLKKGCLEAGITIPCGESPTLVDVVAKETVSITGSSLGIIRPKNRAIFGQNLQAGDSIFALASNGIHTNGSMLARKIVEKLPKGYFTPMPAGVGTIGEELLMPTKIYVRPILEMLGKGVEIHYMSNISGGGFRKIMRAKKEFTYMIEDLPEVPKILQYLQRVARIPDQEAYETWNMGLGFAIFAPPKEQLLISKICKKYKVECLKIGYVTKGPKKVVIRPKSIEYKGETLRVR
jgi:phosphoribosylformylglycinamidine cyclo-ligase